MTTFFSPDKKVVVRGQELGLDMAFTALQTIVPGGAILVVDGRAYNQAELLKEIETRRAPLTDVRETETELKKRRAIRAEKRPSIEGWIRALRTGIRAYLGENNPDIEKFGFKAIRVRRKRTAEEKALAAERGRQTRAARHTMGPRQREEIRAPEVDRLVITITNPDGKNPGPDARPSA